MSDQLQPGTTPKPGIYFNVPDEVYFTLNATSKSDLDLIEDSPLTFQTDKLGLLPDRESKSMALGKALHMYVTQPQEFSKLYSRPLTREVCERDGIKLVDDRDSIMAMVTDLNRTKEDEMIKQGVVMDGDTLIAMINTLNETRQAKLPMSGGKDVIVQRILDNQPEETWTEDQLNAMKGTDLKDVMNQLNSARQGLLSTNGSKADLLQRLRDEGQEIVTKWEVVDAFEAQSNPPHPYFLGASASRHEAVEWLNAEGYKGGGWKMWDQVMAEWQEKNPGRIMLSDDQFGHLNGMRDSLMNNKRCCQLLWPEKAHQGVEVVIVWNDKATGELCRAKIDVLRFNYLPVDLKTARSAKVDEFNRSIQSYGYDKQEAHYLNGLEALLGKRPQYMPFVVVEPEPPYLCKAYILSDTFRAIGSGKTADNLALLKQCRDSKTWPGLGDDAEVIEPQAWYATINQRYIPQE